MSGITVEPLKIEIKDEKTDRTIFTDTAKSVVDITNYNELIKKCASIKTTVQEELYDKCYHDLYIIRDDIGQDFLFGNIDFDSMLVDLYEYYKKISQAIIETMEYIEINAPDICNSMQQTLNNQVRENAATVQKDLGGN